MKWFVYLLLTNQNTLYCGYTNNLNKRINTHNKGKGAKYTKTRLPVKLVFFEEYSSKQQAMRREWEIKQLTRKEKNNLIKKYENTRISEPNNGANSSI